MRRCRRGLQRRAVTGFRNHDPRRMNVPPGSPAVLLGDAAPERVPLARLVLAADSTRQVRRDAISYPARQPNNNKNEQNGSKDAATNIHFGLR
jgi:hypothetical protein